MLRKLVDYKKLDHELAALLIETYPDGYGDDDLIVFKNLQGETVQAVELRTTDTVYLVKICKSLSDFIANFDETIERELESKPEKVHDSSDADEFDPELETDMELDEDLD